MTEFTLRLLGLAGCADTVVGDGMIRCARAPARLSAPAPF